MWRRNGEERLPRRGAESWVSTDVTKARVEGAGKEIKTKALFFVAAKAPTHKAKAPTLPKAGRMGHPADGHLRGRRIVCSDGGRHVYEHANFGKQFADADGGVHRNRAERATAHSTSANSSFTAGDFAGHVTGNDQQRHGSAGQCDDGDGAADRQRHQFHRFEC
jgi:hypothetical protein